MQRGKAGAEKHVAQQKAEQERKEQRLKPLRKVANCITSRGYSMTRPQFGFQTNTRVLLPWIEAGEGGNKDILHFPLMLYYPEKLPYHDTVEDACELDSIAAHLDMVRLHWRFLLCSSDSVHVCKLLQLLCQCQATTVLVQSALLSCVLSYHVLECELGFCTAVGSLLRKL